MTYDDPPEWSNPMPRRSYPAGLRIPVCYSSTAFPDYGDACPDDRTGDLAYGLIRLLQILGYGFCMVLQRVRLIAGFLEITAELANLLG